MRKNELKAKLASGANAINGWIAVPNSYQAEVYASCGFDSVTIDMQHGAPDINDIVPLLQAIQLNKDVTAMVRVPWNEPSAIMRVLDAGAFGIICPMINTKAEAEALVSAGRYPPKGGRSNGPFRASQIAGADYQKHANDEILIFAMIETREAMKNLDAILKVDGLDGVYVGPSDLSLSYGKPAVLDVADSEVLEAMQTIAKKTKAAGKYAGVHTDGPKTAHKRFADGYQFTTLLNDIRVLAIGAQNWVRETRGQAKAEAPKSY
jgi:4-hydroxy-2-oxoheptanedioate aldolase